MKRRVKQRGKKTRRQAGGVYRGSNKQKGGIFKGSRRQSGGLIPLLAVPGVIAGLKAVAAATALGAAGAAGNEIVGAISRKVRGGGQRKLRK